VVIADVPSAHMLLFDTETQPGMDDTACILFIQLLDIVVAILNGNSTTPELVSLHNPCSLKQTGMVLYLNL
jgi:hypothetical protein